MSLLTTMSNMFNCLVAISVGFFLALCSGQSLTQAQREEKMKLLAPRVYCGMQHADDYFRDKDDNTTRITEFPWMAMIKLYNPHSNVSHFCSGSLIGQRYLLTSGQCIRVSNILKAEVYLGEYDQYKSEDCVHEAGNEEECSEPLQILGVEKTIIHPGYKFHGWTHNIGLIRLNKRVQYNDYVRPICLPFPGTNFAQIGDNLSLFGWKAVATFISEQRDVKTKNLARLIPNTECDRILNPDRPRVTDAHLCAESLNKTRCSGDIGAPLGFSSRARWHQEGILSLSMKCGVLPDVFTRVSSYLEWILESVEL